MSDNSFDRTVINSRERPLSSDINQALSQDALTLREILRFLSFSNEGFVGDGFFASSTANNLELNLGPGIGWIFDAAQIATSPIDGVSGLLDKSPFLPVALLNSQLVTLSAPPAAGQERYDLIEVRLHRRRQDPASRDVLNAGTGVFDPTIVQKILAFNLDGNVGTVLTPANSTAAISVKRGADAPTGTAVVPSVTTGYRAVAVVYVPNGTTTLANKIRDARRMLFTAGNGGSHAAVFTQQTASPNDVLAILSSMPRPSSLRLGIRATGAGPNSILRIFFIYGDVSSRLVSALPSVRNAGAGANDLLDKVVGTANGALSGSDATALQGSPSLLNVAPGQSYYSIDVQAVSVSGGSITLGDVLHHSLHFSM